MKTTRSLPITWLLVVAASAFSLHTQSISTRAGGSFYKGVLITCVVWATQGQQTPLHKEGGAVEHRLQALDTGQGAPSDLLAQPPFGQPNRYWDKAMRDLLKQPDNPSIRLSKPFEHTQAYPASRHLLQAKKNTKGPCEDKKEDAFFAGVLAGIGTIGGIAACCIGGIIGWQQGVIHGYLPSLRSKKN